LGAVARGKKPLRQFRFILPSTTFLPALKNGRRRK
jgi:hypothetical protein